MKGYIDFIATFTLGMAFASIIEVFLSTPPDHAAANLRAWWLLIRAAK